MEYFRIKQDKRYCHAPVITNIRDITQRRLDISIRNAKRIADVNVAFSNLTDKVDFLDILDTQLFLISHGVKTVFFMYEPAIMLKHVCILNNETDEYGRYFLPLFPEVDCISESSLLTPDKSQVKKLILKKPPKQYSVFKASGILTDIVIVRVDVAESLLRRGIRKFVLEPLEVEETDEWTG